MRRFLRGCVIALFPGEERRSFPGKERRSFPGEERRLGERFLPTLALLRAWPPLRELTFFLWRGPVETVVLRCRVRPFLRAGTACSCFFLLLLSALPGATDPCVHGTNVRASGSHIIFCAAAGFDGLAVGVRSRTFFFCVLTVIDGDVLLQFSQPTIRGGPAEVFVCCRWCKANGACQTF